MSVQPLWSPSEPQIQSSNISKFVHAVNREYGISIEGYTSLYRWSISEPEKFWSSMWDFSALIGTKGDQTLIDGDQFPGARWFPQASLNFAENLLRNRSSSSAIIFQGEDKVRQSLSYSQLYQQVSILSQAMKAAGVTSGDCIAGFMPNVPATVVAMLATTGLGAIWSSCSPDFGNKGVIDRFGQIEPKLLFTADGYFYNGKTHDSLERVARFSERLPSLEKVIVVPYIEKGELPIDSAVPFVTHEQFTDGYGPAEIEFEQFPFDHPLYILYSSGTTGVPKSIVHGAGGTLIQHCKEHLLHGDTKPGDRTFYFTTCGWMMWNWLITALACEATLVLYDGSPFYPDGNVLFDLADRENITTFGTSAKFIDALKNSGLKPRQTHKLDSIGTVLSTGSPLSPEGFEYVYQDIKPDVRLSSISGGTDIMSCFALGCPVLPVWKGELQTRGLGMAVEVFDDDGSPIKECKGELVCTTPFPSAPVGFWNDHDGTRYRAAYFEKYSNIWCHGDYVELTAHDGMIIYGRSDAVLNPGGVRIGTAEIYRQVEALDEIEESIVVGQDWDNDVRVVLFVKLKQGLILDDGLRDKIKSHVRKETTPRHVPAKIVQVTDIPRTKSGKIVELAVRKIIHNQPVKNLEALANPEALELFQDREELST